LFHRPNLDRVSIEGYNEEGTTTTPFSMMLVNKTSRFHVALAAVRGGRHNPTIQVKRQELLTTLHHAIKKANVHLPPNDADNRNMRRNMERIRMIVMLFLSSMIGNQRRLKLLRGQKRRSSLSIKVIFVFIGCV
jgi:XFP C-terminal domain